ncbi:MULTISPECIES: SRPBCC domain-containing protein [unclassified Aureimonas]|uniref:SRPBCC domain-containing protein n=1 Tax=unclassified Aureimonas TaxID=2615206 RepID=UPI0006FAB3EC|nr:MULTISPECIES: SRPBCC domain-containing protein [unclassified Aureimonas]KQT62938.1 ATPase [Aureimonas sp. Leaf427]KQT74825.1 ATPase [Aureimonas sp. Leaf460]
MDQKGNRTDSHGNRSPVERKGLRELVITRTFHAPPSAVYEAWSQPASFRQWWVPASASGVVLVSCEMDVRTGGQYRLEFGTAGSGTMAFFGRYLEVVPNERIVWTNDEGEEGAVTTVTFGVTDGRTLLTFHELYPSEEEIEEALRGGAAALPEQLEQLDGLLSVETE